jgi:hypothetical protein
LGCLIGPECKRATGTLQDCSGIQAAEDASLVVLSRIENGRDGIVWIDEESLTRGTMAVSTSGSRQAEIVGAFETKDMPREKTPS